MFNDLYVNMVRAGEASGALDIVLIRLAEYTERAAALRGKVRSALTYPVFMGIGGDGHPVLPAVLRRAQGDAHLRGDARQAADDDRSSCSPSAASCRTTGGPSSAVIVIAVIAVRVSIRTPAGRLRFDALTLRIPYFGKVLKKVALARFARTLSTLLLGGIPLLQALDIVKHVVSNMVLSNAIEDGRNSIREGHSVADPLKKSGLFPPLLVHMIAVGEKSGELEQMLARAADAYDGEVEASVSALSSIMEPVLVIFMGGVVLFIVLAILLPIFELNQLVK